MSEGTEPIDELSCHIAPCCGEAILAPDHMAAEAAEAIKDHIAECMVGVISRDQTPEDHAASVASVRKMFE